MTEANDIDDRLSPRPDQITIDRQAHAADPKLSAWVSANAGSGKTYVLSTRVIRLLLIGVEPSKILCLTYTKTAAAEMKNRVFSRLGRWATMSDEDIAKELAAITQTVPTEADISFSRTLFARALETPGGLKIQTIHAFCEALLHRFPLEANIAGHFELIDETEANYLIADAKKQLLTGENETGRAAILRVLQRSGESGLENLLGEIINKRQQLDQLLSTLGDAQERRDSYLSAHDFNNNDTVAEIEASAWPLPGLTMEYCRDAVDLVPEKGGKVAKDLLRALAAIYGNSDEPVQFAGIVPLFLTQKNEIRSIGSLETSKVIEVVPDLAERFMRAAQHVLAVVSRVNLFDEIDRTMDALTIADKLLELYSRLKNNRGLLDFDDLIQRTELMLTKENVAAWVRYKLDQGIDHILVDEAQDTSPPQWRVIKTLADEFFDGEGAGSEKRTVFAVGDEKQSIYSFQGADPRGFDDARSHFGLKVKRANREFKAVDLEASFRSTGDVLDAVDKVFEFESHQRGLIASSRSMQRHQSLRENQPGAVEVWDFERAQDVEKEEDWRKAYDEARQPAVIVAGRIADRIAHWLKSKACLEANGKRIKAGDIIVLVRKRDAFVHALSRALKQHKVPVAGADRLTMTGHIAILDLMALGRIMLNQGDDLSLAALLRSPLFGWTEEQLFHLSHGRQEQSLYEALRAKISEDKQAADAYGQLERWRTLALNQPVFEFYSAVLVVDDGRAKLISRLGPETGDMLDEFLSYAIAQERTGSVSLETFIGTLDNFAPEIKREMEGDKDHVRIMTVHGAKGLEAPIVFLVDSGGAPHGGHSAPLLLPTPLDNGLENPIEAVLWGNSGKYQSEISAAIIANIKQKAEEEYHRLLYVGMTRAADQLIVAGYAGKNGGKDDTWLSMVKVSLEPHSQSLDYGGFAGIRYPAEQRLEAHGPREDRESEIPSAFVVPTCFSAPAPKEPPALRPLVPSGVTGFALEPDRQDSDGEAPASLLEQYSAAGGNHSVAPNLAAKRGTAIHKLLQVIPDIEVGERRAKAFDYCRHIEKRWTDADIELILKQVFGLLDAPEFSAFFHNDARAEVSVMGTVCIGGQNRAVSGVIDRISVLDDIVYIIDYKTNTKPPRNLSEVPVVYRRQMALYHALVAPLYSEKTVKAALLFTATPQLIELDKNTMNQALDDMVSH